MMNKPELIAELNALSGQLGRQLSIEGSKPELEARLSEARLELSMLDDDDAEGDVAAVGEPITAATIPAELQPEMREEGEAALRRILLKATLDIWHYKEGVNKRRPETVIRVCEVVPAGQVIVVDADEAEALIDENYADAV
ncbi:DNA-packaging protein FI [Serratia rhizosphaerae]